MCVYGLCPAAAASAGWLAGCWCVHTWLCITLRTALIQYQEHFASLVYVWLRFGTLGVVLRWFQNKTADFLSLTFNRAQFYRLYTPPVYIRSAIALEAHRVLTRGNVVLPYTYICITSERTRTEKQIRNHYDASVWVTAAKPTISLSFAHHSPSTNRV